MKTSRLNITKVTFLNSKILEQDMVLSLMLIITDNGHHCLASIYLYDIRGI